MPEAVIVATARSPIGRAFKGSLKDLRPDDLTARIVRAALDKVPELDPADIDDLLLGCGLPGGEQGYNMARVVAVLLGYDRLPGATITRYCSSSLQTTRMAFHAIKSGEADVIVSAGVEMVSRFAKGSSDGLPDTANPAYDDAKARTAERAEGGAGAWHDPREDGQIPDVYIAMGQTAENVAELHGITREEQDEFGVRSQNLAEKAIKNGFFEREIIPVELPDGTIVDKDDGPRSGTTLDKVSALKPSFRPGRHGQRRQLLPAQRRRRRRDRDERHQGRRARPDPDRPHRFLRRLGAVTGDHGSRAGRGVAAGAQTRGPHDRRHRSRGDQRGVRRAGDPLVPPSSASTSTSSTSTAARSLSVTPSA